MITYLKGFSSSLFFPRYWTTFSSVWIYAFPPILSKIPLGSTPGPKACGMAKRWWRHVWKYLVLLASAKFPLMVNGWKASSLSAKTSSKNLCTRARPVIVWLNCSKPNPVKATYCFMCAAYRLLFASLLKMSHYHIKITSRFTFIPRRINRRKFFVQNNALQFECCLFNFRTALRYLHQSVN